MPQVFQKYTIFYVFLQNWDLVQGGPCTRWGKEKNMREEKVTEET